MALVGAVACGGGSDEEVFDPGAQAKPTSGGATTGGGGGAAAESIKVIMKDNLFEPKALTVPAGKSVQIEVKNEGQAVHNMHILSAA